MEYSLTSSKSIPVIPSMPVNIINNLNDISTNINDLLKNNETIIINYVERYIYNAILPDNITTDIQLIFNTIHKQFIPSNL